MKKLGTYRYSYALEVWPSVTLHNFSMRVEVLATKSGRHKIRFMDFHADGRGPDTVTWVTTAKVKLDTPEAPPAIDVRLPYADD